MNTINTITRGMNFAGIPKIGGKNIYASNAAAANTEKNLKDEAIKDAYSTVIIWSKDEIAKHKVENGKIYNIYKNGMKEITDPKTNIGAIAMPNGYQIEILKADADGNPTELCLSKEGTRICKNIEFETNLPSENYDRGSRTIRIKGIPGYDSVVIMGIDNTAYFGSKKDDYYKKVVEDIEKGLIPKIQWYGYIIETPEENRGVTKISNTRQVYDSGGKVFVGKPHSGIYVTYIFLVSDGVIDGTLCGERIKAEDSDCTALKYPDYYSVGKKSQKPYEWKDTDGNGTSERQESVDWKNAVNFKRSIPNEMILEVIKKGF